MYVLLFFFDVDGFILTKMLVLQCLNAFWLYKMIQSVLRKIARAKRGEPVATELKKDD